jgi:hypothetical protein
VLKAYANDGYNDVSFSQIFHRGSCHRCTFIENQENSFCNKLLANLACAKKHLSIVHSVQKSQRNRTRYIAGSLTPSFNPLGESEVSSPENERQVKQLTLNQRTSQQLESSTKAVNPERHQQARKTSKNQNQDANIVAETDITKEDKEEIQDTEKKPPGDTSSPFPKFKPKMRKKLSMENDVNSKIEENLSEVNTQEQLKPTQNESCKSFFSREHQQEMAQRNKKHGKIEAKLTQIQTKEEKAIEEDHQSHNNNQKIGEDSNQRKNIGQKKRTEAVKKENYSSKLRNQGKNKTENGENKDQILLQSHRNEETEESNEGFQNEYNGESQRQKEDNTEKHILEVKINDRREYMKDRDIWGRLPWNVPQDVQEADRKLRSKSYAKRRANSKLEEDHIETEDQRQSRNTQTKRSKSFFNKGKDDNDIHNNDVLEEDIAESSIKPAPENYLKESAIEESLIEMNEDHPTEFGNEAEERYNEEEQNITIERSQYESFLQRNLGEDFMNETSNVIPEKETTETETTEIETTEAEITETETNDDQKDGNELATNKKAELMSKWNIEDEDLFKVIVPRLKGKDVTKIRSGLKTLIKENLIPLIKQCTPKSTAATEQTFYDETFNHMTALLQLHIRKKLKCFGFKGAKPLRRKRNAMLMGKKRYQKIF